MKVLIVYDSQYGNTEKVAHSMAHAIPGDVTVLHGSKALSSDIESMDVLIVGSPTQGFRATNSIKTFLKAIPEGALEGKTVAAFDTRMSASDVGTGLRFLMKIGGYAAPGIADVLKKKGGSLALPPEGFFVTDKEGPLQEGELQRAASWVKTIIKEKQ